MRPCPLLRLICLIACLLGSTVTTATETFRPENTDFYLVTVGLGEDIEARYGHTMLRLVDATTGHEHNLNWGTFSWDDPHFVGNFLAGRLRYWVSDSTFRSIVSVYTAWNRTIYDQKINLTLPQKADLLMRLSVATAPENRYFWYHFFTKNCSTILRDMFSEVLHGRLRETFDHPRERITYRQYVRDYLSGPLFSSFFLEIIMNDTIDHPITPWDEMFHPLKLKDYLSEAPAYDDHGNPQPNSTLLEPAAVIYQAHPEVVPGPSPAFQLFLALSVLVLAGGLFLLLLNPQPGRGRSLGFMLWGGYSMLFGLLAAIVGTAMAVFWLFSGHEELKHSANLWLFWPTDWYVIGIGARTLWRRTMTRSRFGTFYCIAHLCATVAIVVLWATGFITQDMSLTLPYVAPVLVLLYGGILTISRKGSDFKVTD